MAYNLFWGYYAQMTSSFIKTILIYLVKLNCLQQRQLHDHLSELQAMASMQS